MIDTKRTRRFSRQEREIAIAAIATRVTGTPASAALQLLAGIAVLNGNHEPIAIWPDDSTRESRAAWHEREATCWRESAAQHAVMERGSDSAFGTRPALQDDPSTVEQVEPLARSVSSVAARHEVGTQNPLRPVSVERPAGSSDAY